MADAVRRTRQIPPKIDHLEPHKNPGKEAFFSGVFLLCFLLTDQIFGFPRIPWQSLRISKNFKPSTRPSRSNVNVPRAPTVCCNKCRQLATKKLDEWMQGTDGPLPAIDRVINHVISRVISLVAHLQLQGQLIGVIPFITGEGAHLVGGFSCGFVSKTESSVVRSPVLHVFVFSWFSFCQESRWYQI